MAAGFGRFHCCDNPIHILPQHWPLGIAQDDDRNCANREILLIANILVGGRQYVADYRLRISGTQLLTTDYEPPTLSRYRTKSAIANKQLTEKSNQENGKNGRLAFW